MNSMKNKNNSLMQENTVYISNINYRCGDWNPVVEAPGMEGDIETVTYLNNLGINRYSKLTESLNELAVTCIGETINESRIDASEFDATIFFSTTFDTYEQHSDLSLALNELKLSNAIPYGVFHNQCANYSQAIMMAKMLCGNNEAQNILIIGYDALNDDISERVLPSKTSVYSDVFISFVVSKNKSKDSYRVDGIMNRYFPELLTYQPEEDMFKFITEYSNNFKNVCDDLNNLLSRTPSDYEMLITANYNTSVVRNLAELAGFKQDKLYKSNISKFSHCFAADQLISLKTLIHDQPLNDKSSYLLTAVGGFVLFNAMSVTRM